MKLSPLRTAMLAGAMVLSPLLWAQQTPNFTGTWQLDPAKSQANVRDEAVTLTIQDNSPNIQFKRVARQAGGHESVSTFTCQTGGKECDFDENGHKAKVSLWYDGSALVILKTDGPKEDAVTQWRLELSPDGKTLSVVLTHIDPSENEEKLVFDKETS
jgi:hypothetical protein